MSAGRGNGRIHMLTDKQASKLGRQNATLDEATEIAQAVAIKVAEHYFDQVPGLVGTIVEAALAAYDKSVLERSIVSNGAEKHGVVSADCIQGPTDTVPPVTEVAE